MPYPVMSVGDGIVNWSILMPSKIIHCTHVSILKQLFEEPCSSVLNLFQSCQDQTAWLFYDVVFLCIAHLGMVPSFYY